MRKRAEPGERQVVYVNPELATAIRQHYIDTTGKDHGAIQRTLARGAELAMAELRGELNTEKFQGVAANLGTYNGIELGTGKSTRYTSLHVVDAAKRAVLSLRGVAVEIETALETDVAISSTADPESEEFKQFVRDKSAKADKLIEEARESAAEHQRAKEDSTRNAKRIHRKTSGGAA